VRLVALPSRIEVRSSALMFSCKLVVFSNLMVRHFCNDQAKLTCDSAVFDSEELGFVITRDCGVAVHISREERQGLLRLVCRFHD